MTIWFTYAVIAAFLTSLTSILEKKTLGKMHSIDFTSFQAVLAALVTLPILFQFEIWQTISLKIISLCFVVSVIATFAMFDVIRGVRHLEISESAPLFLLNPFFTTLLAYMVLGEKLSALQLVGIALLMLGTYVLETKQISDIRGFLHNIGGNKYARFIIIGMVLYATTSLFDRIMLGYWHIPPMFYVALVQVFLAFDFIILFFWHNRNQVSTFRETFSHWKIVLLIAVLTSAARIMFSTSVALASVGLVTAVKRSSSLFTTVIGGELFNDGNILRKSVACSIMILGVLLLAL
jgi:drug/metabolite transporter (DMT)-like permease